MSREINIIKQKIQSINVINLTSFTKCEQILLKVYTIFLYYE